MLNWSAQKEKTALFCIFVADAIINAIDEFVTNRNRQLPVLNFHIPLNLEGSNDTRTCRKRKKDIKNIKKSNLLDT